MKKLILHIGAHKTGSTSIQTFLQHRQAKLLTQNWEFIIINGENNLGNLVKWEHNGKLTYSLRPSGLNRLVKTLSRTKGNCIISAEDFFFLNDEKILTRLRDSLLDIFQEIHIIVYLRRQDSMAISQKAQGARTIQSSLIFGNTPSALPEITGDVREYLEYDKKILKWGRLFGPGNITVRIFDKSRLSENDAITDFIETSKLPIQPGTSSKNISFGPQPTLLLHMLRRKGIPNSVIWPLYRGGFIKDLPGPKILPSRAEASAFLDEFAASNRRLAELLGMDEVFGEDFDAYPLTKTHVKQDLNYAIKTIEKITKRMQLVVSNEIAVFLREVAADILPARSGRSFKLRSLADHIDSCMLAEYQPSDPTGSLFEKGSDSSSGVQAAVLDSLIEWMRTLGVVANGKSATLFRNVAMAVEQQNLTQAQRLMMLAYIIRPYESVTRRKMAAYRHELGRLEHWPATFREESIRHSSPEKLQLLWRKAREIFNK